MKTDWKKAYERLNLLGLPIWIYLALKWWNTDPHCADFAILCAYGNLTIHWPKVFPIDDTMQSA